MKLVLPYFIILLAIFQFFLKKNTKKHEELNKEYWKRAVSQEKDLSDRGKPHQTGESRD